MAWTKGVVVFIGDYGNPESHLAKSMYRDITDSAALDTFVTALALRTDCNIYSKHFNSVTETGSGAPDASANVDIKAMIVVKDSADGSIHKFMIPAPKAADFEEQGQGDRYTDAALSAFVTALNVATGKTYIGLYGKKLQKT
jgi:hypothetical protein